MDNKENSSKNAEEVLDEIGDKPTQENSEKKKQNRQLLAFLIDYLNQGHIGILAAILMISSIQVFMMGLLGQLIVHSRFIRAIPQVKTTQSEKQYPLKRVS